jgi:hypothetical protein
MMVLLIFQLDKMTSSAKWCFNLRDIELNNGCSLKRTFKQLLASFSLALSAATKIKPYVFEI